MIARLAFLAGLIAVPMVLLYVGHHFRRRGARNRALFWGGSLGYLAGVALTVGFALFPPVDWAGGPAARTWAVHWSMLAGAVAGAVIGVLGRARS